MYQGGTLLLQSVNSVGLRSSGVFAHNTQHIIKAYTDHCLYVGFWYRVYVEFTYIRSLSDTNTENTKNTKIDYLWSYFCDINT